MNYECHITIKAEAANIGEKVAAEMQWKTSEIKRDPILGPDTHFYLTAHDTDLGRMTRKMHHTACYLENEGAEVLRKKIELIVYDTKTGVGL